MINKTMLGGFDRWLSMASTLAAVALAAGVVSCKKNSEHAATALNSDEQKAMYSLGIQVGQGLRGYNLNPGELALVKMGIDDSATGKDPKVDPSAFRPKLMEILRARQQELAAAEKARGKEAVDKAATEPGAEKLPSGMVIKMLKTGAGPNPTVEDTVKVNYEGKLLDGTVFDSSYKRNQPAEFGLRGVIKCWTEGLQKMAPGGQARLTCPSDLAYGDRGKPPTIAANATLVFEVELLDIVKH